MKTLAIIPARGGSKRIAGKNIKEFCSKPIIAYSIEAAMKAQIFDEVAVSTDDDSIAAIAKDFGAKVPFKRSEKASNDFATTADVINEVIECYEKEGKTFDFICCIYATAPFVTAKKLRDSFELFKQSTADSLIPVVKFDYPIQRALKVTGNKLEMIHPENTFVRTQDLESAYHDCGQFYWLRTKSFLKQNSFFMENTIPYELPPNEVKDIDTPDDWKIAEVLYKCLNTD